MPKTVEQAYGEFLANLTPTQTEINNAASHRESIKTCLEASFTLNAFFRSGSFGNGTSIRNHSDLDYFAEIARANIPQSSVAFLTKVKSPLATRFPNTDVCIRTPAVCLPFTTGTVEVVPADNVGETSKGERIFDIADGQGGWMRASPEAHNRYVAEVDAKLSGKVRPLVRFLKAWNYHRNGGIRSFYLELRVAKYASGERSIVYPIDVRAVVKELIDCQLAAVIDPVGVSGYVQPCSDAQKVDALSRLNTALSRADNALQADKDGKIADAISWWQSFFGEHFPAYS